MATSVTLPELGESVTEGTVTRWLKEVGDEVAVDEPLLEISTDKVDTEIPSPAAGTLLEQKVAEDETVEIGAELAVIGDEGESSGGDSGESDESSDESPKESTDESAEESQDEEPEPAPEEEQEEAKAEPESDDPSPTTPSPTTPSPTTPGRTTLGRTTAAVPTTPLTRNPTSRPRRPATAPR